MRATFTRSALLALSLGASLVIACSSPSDTSSGSSSNEGGHDAGVDAPASTVLHIEPDSLAQTVTLGVAPPPIAYHAFAKTGDLAEVDVTDQVEWSVGAKIGTVSGGVVSLTGFGGKTTVTATLAGVEASSALTVKVVGDVFAGGADTTTKEGFDGASADPDSSAAPVIEYPEDGAVLPGNLPPIEPQWTQAADNAAYRVRVASPDVLEIALYTTERELLFPADVWAVIAGSTPDVATSITVDGLGGGMIRSSAPRSITVSSDVIDESAIYVWQSSTGSFRVLDITKGTDIALPTDAPALQAGQPCSGCHRISRDGKRFSYTYNGGNFEFGTLALDAQNGVYTQKIAPSIAFRATYASFNPLETSTAAAMLVTVPDTVPQNTAGTVRLQLLDPDTGAPLPSNIDAATAMIDPAVGHATSMPDWSPNGDFVVFAAYDSDKNYVRLLGDDIVLASIVEAQVTYDAVNGFTFGAPKVLVASPGGDPDTGQNNLLPTISPDGSAVAFTRAAGWWSIKTQQSLINLSGQIAVVRRSDGQVFELVKGSNGPGTTWSSTWPQWAPTTGKRYAWLAYGSERPYGHRLTTASPENAQCNLVQGQKQCKHLWVTAIDLAKLASGTADPSEAPFFIPGQTIAAQYVSPQWTKAVLEPPQ